MEERNGFSIIGFIAQVLIILLVIFILMWLFPTKNYLNNNIKTVLTGCVAQVEKEELLEKDYIDFVIGNDEKLKLADYLLSDTKFAVQNIMEQSKFNDTLLFDTTRAFPYLSAPRSRKQFLYPWAQTY